jgi:hypothetical protein
MSVLCQFFALNCNMCKKILGLFLITILLSSCSLSDLRTPSLKNSFNAESNDKGVSLLRKAAEKQGLTQWRNHQSYHLNFMDTFFGIKGAFVRPFPKSTNTLMLDGATDSYNGILSFSGGSKNGKQWAYLDHKTYLKKVGDKWGLKDKSKIKFWIPTYKYFIEFGFKIIETDVVTYAGSVDYDNNTYDLVLASWKSLAPQKDIDQYLVWINQKTGLINIAQFTVRDQFKFIVATAFFQDYKDINGAMIPHDIAIKGKKLDSGLLHHIKVQSFEFDKMSTESIFSSIK